MSNPVQPWPVLPLGTLASELCLGKMLDKQKNRGTLQPYLRNVNVRWFSFDSNDLKEMRFEEGEATRYGLQPGDLVICEGGEPGRAAVWKGQSEHAKIQEALHRVRFRSDEYDPSFAMYYLYFGTITHRFAPYYTGTTIKHLTGAALSQIFFPIPPLNEQRRIVQKIEELFSKLDAGVAALERVKAGLKRYRAAVLKAAVEGKLTAEWRAHHPAKETGAQLLGRILDERRRKWEQEQRAKYAKAGKQPPKGWQAKYKEPTGPDTSYLPALPEGWCWATLDVLLREPLRNGHSARASKDGRGVRTLTLTAVTVGDFSEKNTKLTTAQPDKVQDLWLQGGDILIERSNTPELVGTARMYKGPTNFAIFPDLLIRVRVSLAVVDRYVDVFLQSHFARAYFRQRAKGLAGSMPKIDQGTILQLPIPLPPSDEQRELVDEVDRRLSVVDEIEAQIETDLKRASRLRQSILKRAFEGRLVPQDPDDEPAEHLLQKIRQGREGESGHAARRRKQKASAL